MIRRSTWAVVAIFVLLLAATLIYQRTQGQPKAVATPTVNANAMLFNLDEKSVVSLHIEGAGKVVDIGRDASGSWLVNEPKGGPTDAGKVESAMSQLVNLSIVGTLNPTTDLNVYGLAKANYVITVATNDGKKDVASVGDLTPTSNGYYVRLNDQAPKVVSKYSMDALLGLLNNPPFQDTPTPTLGTPAVTETVTTTVTTTPVITGTVQP